jgi:hypothetical protein
MKRHEFIMGLGGATVWSVLVRAQQSGRIPVVGVLMAFSKSGRGSPLTLIGSEKVSVNRDIFRSFNRWSRRQG